MVIGSVGYNLPIHGIKLGLQPPLIRSPLIIFDVNFQQDIQADLLLYNLENTGKYMPSRYAVLQVSQIAWGFLIDLT